MTTAERTAADQAIAILEATPSTLQAMLGALPPELAQAPGEDGGWSAIDVLGHLVSAEEPALRARIQTILDSDDAEIVNVDGPAVLEELRSRGLSLSGLLAAFADERARTLTVFRSLRDDQLGRTGRHSALGPLSVLNVLSHFAFHDLQHTAQIATAIGRSTYAGRGKLAGVGD
ncbi:MAG: DinB family protein [Chloroflexi bacterium]|nr:DinB family protein [Chloroflexota bacterium]